MDGAAAGGWESLRGGGGMGWTRGWGWGVTPPTGMGLQTPAAAMAVEGPARRSRRASTALPSAAQRRHHTPVAGTARWSRLAPAARASAECVAPASAARRWLGPAYGPNGAEPQPLSPHLGAPPFAANAARAARASPATATPRPAIVATSAATRPSVTAVAAQSPPATARGTRATQSWGVPVTVLAAAGRPVRGGWGVSQQQPPPDAATANAAPPPQPRSLPGRVKGDPYPRPAIEGGGHALGSSRRAAARRTGSELAEANLGSGLGDRH